MCANTTWMHHPELQHFKHVAFYQSVVKNGHEISETAATRRRGIAIDGPRAAQWCGVSSEVQ